MLGLLVAVTLSAPGPPEVQRPSEAVPWALNWDAPASCPTRAELIAGVRAYLPELDDPPEQVGRARLRVEAEILELEPGGATPWQARIEFDGEHGSSSRRFSAASCPELVDATALILAAALDPVLTAERVARTREELQASERLSSGEASPAAAPEHAPPTREDAPADTLAPRAEGSSAEAPLHPVVETERGSGRPPSSTRPHVGLRAFGGGGLGPTLTGYGSLGLGLAVFARRWRWSLEGGVWLPRTLVFAEVAGRFFGWWVGTHGCFVVSPRRAERLELPLCGGAEFGQVWGRGLAPSVDTRRASHPWIAASLGGGLQVTLHERVALFADLDLVLPVVRAEFDVGERTVQRLSPVGVRATVGVELRF